MGRRGRQRRAARARRAAAAGCCGTWGGSRWRGEAAAVAVFKGGRGVRLGEGGAGSGSASGGMPRPDSVAAARAWLGSAGP